MEEFNKNNIRLVVLVSFLGSLFASLFFNFAIYSPTSFGSPPPIGNPIMLNPFPGVSCGNGTGTDVAPIIHGILPTSTQVQPADGPGIELRVSATGIQNGTNVIFDGIKIWAYCIEPNLLAAQITAEYLREEDTVGVQVVNLNGLSSDSLYFRVFQSPGE